MNKQIQAVLTKIQHEAHIKRSNSISREMAVSRVLREAFTNRKFAPGKVAFSKSSFKDPHIQRVIEEISRQTKITPEQIIAEVNKKIAEFQDIANKSPSLYATIKDNIVEDTVYQIFESHPIKINSPKFSVTVFYELIRSIQSDHDEFFPLRSFIDQKHLHSPRIIFVGAGHKSPGPEYDKVKTAAASPYGEFIFNIDFIQKLLDYAHLKKLNPKGRKYVSNGGTIPDEYAYVEFIIIHEFMHYTNDDFYYQKIIPNANGNIINWVGDFRTNYLLVKSGYEQLPMGLYNDHINYDRQMTYVEMYNIVKSEFEKLNKDQQKKLGKALDNMGDDHGPGRQQGNESQTAEGGKDANGKPIDPSKIDEKAEATEGQMRNSKDSNLGDKPKSVPPAEQPKSSTPGGTGAATNAAPTQIDYSKIKPRFNWAQLIKHFIAAAKTRTEETYQKPSRRGVSGLHIAAQVGKAAVKPAEVKIDFNEINLAFVIDSSGSMTEAISKVYANIHNLLKQPGFAKTLFTLLKFSGSHIIYKGNFQKNIAALVQNVDEIPKSFDKKLNVVFSEHIGSATNFNAALVTDIEKLTKKKTNILIFSDNDILDGTNLTNLLHLLKTHTRSVFILFDSRDTYLMFRQAVNISTPNISYIE